MAVRGHMPRTQDSVSNDIVSKKGLVKPHTYHSEINFLPSATKDSPTVTSA